MLWTEKYRPKYLEEIVGQEKFVSDARNWTSMPNLLLYGPAGTGKTTAAGVIANIILKEHQQSNYFEPLKYTDSMLRRIYNENKFTETTYDDFKKAYGLLYTKMSQLPLVQFDELTEEQEENYEIIEGGAVDWMLRYLKVKSPLGSIVEEND